MELVSSRAASPLQAVPSAERAPPRDVVIATKLYVPRPPEGPVARPRLAEQLASGIRGPVTLVVAPAGWGKSSLVSQWLHDGMLPAGWVSLDRGDDDVTRFWRYLLAAADHAAPGVATGALRRLDAPGADVLRDVLPIFVNDLADLTAPVLL